MTYNCFSDKFPKARKPHVCDECRRSIPKGTVYQKKTETIPAMRLRHATEIHDTIQAQADARITQAEAARNLGMTPQALNEYIQRKGIIWPVKEPGRNKRTENRE